MDKFKVVDGSELGHCCIKATVIDTSKPKRHCDTGEILGYKVVCECLTKDDAELIAGLMNNAKGEL